MSIEEEQIKYYDAAYTAGIDSTICAVIAILSFVVCLIIRESAYFGVAVSVDITMFGATFYFYLKETLNKLRASQLYYQYEKNIGSDEEEHF